MLNGLFALLHLGSGDYVSVVPKFKAPLTLLHLDGRNYLYLEKTEPDFGFSIRNGIIVYEWTDPIGNHGITIVHLVYFAKWTDSAFAFHPLFDPFYPFMRGLFDSLCGPWQVVRRVDFEF